MRSISAAVGRQFPFRLRSFRAGRSAPRACKNPGEHKAPSWAGRRPRHIWIPCPQRQSLSHIQVGHRTRGPPASEMLAHAAALRGTGRIGPAGMKGVRLGASTRPRSRGKIGAAAVLPIEQTSHPPANWKSRVPLATQGSGFWEKPGPLPSFCDKCGGDPERGHRERTTACRDHSTSKQHVIPSTKKARGVRPSLTGCRGLLRGTSAAARSTPAWRPGRR